MRRIRGFVFFLLAFLVLTFAQTHSFSLEEAQKMALENNFKIRQARLDIKSAIKQVNAAIGQGLLTVDGSFALAHNFDLPVSVATLTSPNGNTETLTSKFGTSNNLSVGVNANLLLFDGTYVVGVQAAKAYEAFVRLQKTVQDHEVIDAVTQAYYAVIAAQKNLEYLRESEKNTNKVVEDMTVMYQVGYIEETDLDQVRVNQIKVQNNIYTLEQQQEIAEKMFKYQVGLNLSASIALTDSLEQFMSLDPEYIQKLRAVYEPQWDIQYKLTEQNRDLLYKNTLVTYFKMLPTVAVFGNLGYQSNVDNFNFSNNSSTPTAIGLSVKVPIFSSYSRMSAGQQAKVEWEKAKVLVESTGQDLALQMESLRAEYYANFASYQASRKNMDLYHKIYSNAEVKFTNAKMSSYEFAQMQLQFIQAQTDYVSSMVSLLNTQSKIQKVFNNQSKSTR